MTKKELIDRFEGTLLGLAVGDALGAPVEFMTTKQISETYGGRLKEMVGGGWLKSKPGEYTDDTAMMLCIAESLVENQGYNLDDIIQRFVRWYRSNPPDIGNITRRALEKIAGGIHWQEASNKKRPSNGSVMRCAPIGLIYALNTPELVRVSIETSVITHAHEDAILSCVFLNTMIANLVQGAGGFTAFRAAAAVIFENFSVLRSNSFIKKLSITRANPASGLAVDTLVLATFGFTKAESFEEAVVRAVNLGGDTDTIGAVAGALAGAYYGASAIPERWSSKLNPYSAEKITSLARKLFELKK